MTIRCALALLLFLSATGVTAAMYKWVDEDGVTHYTQQPPPAGIEAETMKPPPAVDSKAAGESLQKRLQQFEKNDKEKGEQTEKQQETRLTAQEKKENCRKARERLTSFQRPRVNFVDKDGTRRRASEEERQRELKRARDYLQEHCR